jgi:pimeloyl-ACP methyl ester carboxylesterase
MVLTEAGMLSSHVLETDTGVVSFFQQGKTSNLPALVLLPGLTCSARDLLESFSPLARMTRLVAIDWRGHGGSTASEESTSIQDLAEDAMEVIRSRLDGRKICILGHSVGARVIWSMLDTYDDELKGVLEGIAVIDQDPRRTIGRTSAGPHDTLFAAHTEVSINLRSGHQQFLNELRRLFTVENGFAPSLVALSKWWKFASRCDQATIADMHWDAMTSDFTHVVHGIEVPTLVMIGDASMDPKGIPARLARGVPARGAHCALLPGGSHLPFNQPELVPEMVRLVSSLLNGSLEKCPVPPTRINSRTPAFAQPLQVPLQGLRCAPLQPTHLHQGFPGFRAPPYRWAGA